MLKEIQRYFETPVVKACPNQNRQILQSLISQARQLGKSLYVLSVEPETDKVAHANYVAPSLRERGADARKWSSQVAEVLGGKVYFNHSLKGQ
jgi:alanyl-tRNA synthetase